MGVEFPYQALEAGVLELEPGATDADVVGTIATLVQVHLGGSTPDQAAAFFYTLLPMMAGMTAGTMGDEWALAAFEGIPKFMREAGLLDRAVPAGPPN